MNPLTSMVLAILCFQYGQAEPNPNKWTYSLNAKTTVAHRVASNIHSQWHLTADLIVQDFVDSKILKLSNVKTIGYHGRPDEIPEDLVPVAVPEASDILSQPFVAHYENENLGSLSFMAKDPIWSTNMKKAIASVYQVKLNDVPQKSNYQQIENNVYGECVVSYDNSDVESTIHKYFDISDCKNHEDITPLWHDVRYGTTNGNISRVYTYDSNKGKITGLDFTNVHSMAQFTYRNKMEETAKYIIVQEQTLKLIDSSFTEDRVLIHDSSASNRQKPIYQSEQDNVKEQEGETDMDLWKNWLSVYADFKKWFTQEKFEFMNEENYNRLEKLHEMMKSMNVKTLDMFLEKEPGKQNNHIYIFSTLLPTIGTHNSVKLIKYLIKKNAIIDVGGMRIIASYPFHLKSPSVELIKQMEEFLDLDNIKNEMIRHVYILSFSNLVGSLNKYIDYSKPNPVYTRIIEQYVEKYYNSYLETDDYDLRMKYILGLMNMGPLASHNLLSIIQNTTESVHCRILATNAIRQNNYLEQPEPFQRFWPIVINPGENYELRVAALSVLLEASSMDISEIYAILRYMNQTSDNPVEQHLFNYFYTTMTSNKREYHGSKALSPEVVDLIVPQLKKPVAMKSLMTGNYYMGYHNHIGTDIDTISIANPETNCPSYVHMSLKNYLDEHNRLDSYSFYLRIGNNFHRRIFYAWNGANYPVKDLLKIIQMAKVALKDLRRDVHIEIGLLYDNRAVFTMFADESNKHKDLNQHMFKLLLDYFEMNDIVTMNDISRSNFVSDLGTPITLVVREKEIYSARINSSEFVNISMRYAWGSTVDYKAVNPLTNINHGIIDVYSNQKSFHLKFKYNRETETIKWKDEDLYLENLWEINPASYVEMGENTNLHCPKCVAVQFIRGKMPNPERYDFKTSLKAIVLSVNNFTNIRKINEPEWNNYVNVIMPNARYPEAALLWIKYTADYLYYLPRFDIATILLALEPVTTEPSEFILQFANELSPKSKLNTFELYDNYTIHFQQRQLSNEAIMYYSKLNISMNPTEKGQYFKMSLDNNGTSKIDYKPTVKNADIFSSKSAELLTTKTSVYYEKNSESSTMDITSTFEISEEKQRMIKESDDYKTCQKESNRKHSAPTRSCYFSSLEMSTYDNYSINFEVNNAPEEYYCTAIKRGIVTPYRFPKEECNRNFNFSVLYSTLSGRLSSTMGSRSSSVWIDDQFRAKVMAVNRFYDYILHREYGRESYCIITPDYVKTFTEQKIRYEKARTMIPLIECSNNTRVGLLTTRSNDAVDFKLWIDDNIFKVVNKRDDNKLEMTNGNEYTVKINDKLIEDNVYNAEYSIEFLTGNTLYMHTDRLDLFYNQDYVSITINSDLVQRLCGMCATGILTAPNLISDSTHF
ncbi:crossveinless d [Carabus blaptoides fortunei]